MDLPQPPDTLHDTPHEIPHGGPVVTCLVCGYDLRGLGVEGSCPECGAPIAFSIRGDLYRFSDPGRLNRMALGATIIAVTLLLSFPYWIAVNFLDQVLRPFPRAGMTAAIGSAMLILVHAIGWWMLTEREPAASKIDVAVAPETSGSRRERARVWTREAVLFFVLATLGAIVVDMWRTSAWGTGSTLMPGRKLAAAFWFASIVAGVGVLLTGTRHMMAMGRRVPPGKLLPRAEFLFLFVATISGVLAASAALGGVFYGLGMHHAVGFLAQTCGCMSFPLWAVALVGVMMAAHTAAATLRTEREIGLALRRERERTPLP